MYKAVIFDFYRTLSHTEFFLGLESDSRDKIQSLIFSESSDFYWRWLRGEIDKTFICEYLSEALETSAEELLTDLEDSCSKVRLNPILMEFRTLLKQKGIPAGIVTLNFDVFTSLVSPNLDLGDKFDFVINSADHGCSDKKVLYQLALDRLGLPSAEGCLLIDDDPRWIAAFEELGGCTKHFKGDEDFEDWWSSKHPASNGQ